MKGLVLLNCAGAMNNKSLIDDWRLYLLYPLLMLIDFALKTPPVAKFLFERFASKDTIRKVLSSVYSNQEAVDDELVDIIHGPSQDQGALDVFVSVLTGRFQVHVCLCRLCCMSCKAEHTVIRSKNNLSFQS